MLLPLVLGVAASPAFAELYRWVDPQSGSVKYSNHPPPWHGDPARAARSPQVEVIPSRFGEAPAKPAAEAKPASVPADLEMRWRDMLQSIGTLTKKEDFDRAGAGLRQQVEAYDAVRTELDRIDPAGAARRRKEEGSVVEQVKKGIEAWLRK
jgi:hypothetical protein